MIFISMALQSEAKPFISVLKLKRHPETDRFRVYSSSDVVLVVTGTGALKSAVATAFMLTRFAATKHDLFLNIGVCGSVSEEIRPGTVLLANRIKDSTTGKFMYADMLFSHPFQEAGVETFPQPVSRKKAGDMLELADMEASGTFEAARNFLPLHHIAIIKVVMDRLEPACVTQKMIVNTMEKAADKILAWIKDIDSCISGCEAKNMETWPHLYEQALSHMDMSTTLEHELRLLINHLILADPEKTSPAHRELIKTAQQNQKLCRKEVKTFAARLRSMAAQLPVQFPDR